MNNEVAVIVAHECEKTRSLADLADENRSGLSVAGFQALFDDAGRVLLNAELRNLICQFDENWLADSGLPLLNDRAHGVVAIRVRHELD